MMWKRLVNRLKGNAKREEAEVDEELAFHAEMKARELTASGMSPSGPSS